MSPRNEAVDALRDHSPTLYPASNHGSQLVCSCGHIDHMAGWWAHIKVSVMEPMLIAQRERVVERFRERLVSGDYSHLWNKSGGSVIRLLDEVARDVLPDDPDEHVHDWTAGTQVTSSGLPSSTCIAPGHDRASRQEEPPLRGVWEVSSKVALTPYVVEQTIDRLKDAAAEGKQVVVVEGIEFRWRPITVRGWPRGYIRIRTPDDPDGWTAEGEVISGASYIYSSGDVVVELTWDQGSGEPSNG